MRPVQRLGACFGAALLIMYASSGRAAESIAVGQLVAKTGPTSQSLRPMARALQTHSSTSMLTAGWRKKDRARNCRLRL